MHMIEILLPLRDNEGRPFDGALYAKVREELVAQYGGLTAFTRSPAEGLWAEGDKHSRDEIVVLEVMTERLDRWWWQDYRAKLEKRFAQDEIFVRASEVERL